MTTTAIQEYIATNKPAATYLGRQEMLEMKHRATLAGWVEPDAHLCNDDLARLEFHGCPLYEVNAESHVGFSSPPHPVENAAEETQQLRTALQAVQNWYHQDGSVGGCSSVMEIVDAALSSSH